MLVVGVFFMAHCYILSPLISHHHPYIYESPDFEWLEYFPAQFALFTLQFLRRTFASASDVHLSVGDDMALQLEHAGCGPDISNWGCGVDSAIFSPHRGSLSTTPESLRWKITAGKPHRPIISYCGRVAPEKRLELLPSVAIAFLRMYRKEWSEQNRSANRNGGSAAIPSRTVSNSDDPPCLAFVVVGDGPFLDELKRIMAQVGPTWSMEGDGNRELGSGGIGGEGWAQAKPLSKSLGLSMGGISTTFFGQQNHSTALGALYASSDVFFSPSTCETLGQVFQESMASGLVPVGCRFGGVPEVFDHEVEGYLFEPEDFEGAAKMLCRALGDRAAFISSGSQVIPFYIPLLWKDNGDPHRGERARTRVISKSWESAYAQAESSYYRALATRWPYVTNKPLRRYPKLIPKLSPRTRQ